MSVGVQSEGHDKVSIQRERENLVLFVITTEFRQLAH